MKAPAAEILRQNPDYARMEETLLRGRGPGAGFRLTEAQKGHLAAFLGQNSPVLLVTSSETAVVRMTEGINALGVPAFPLMQRDVPLTHVLNAGSNANFSRVRALLRLAQGKPGVVVAGMGAVLQKLAPKRELLKGLITLRTGDKIALPEITARLSAAGYERVDMAEGPGQFAVRGGILDVFGADALLPVRLEFWGDSIDQMRSFEPDTQRSTGQLQTAEFAPNYEVPQPESAMARACRRIAGKEEFAVQYESWSENRPCAGAENLLPLLFERMETVRDYLPEKGIVLLDEPVRLEEAARTGELMFSESVASMLERGEGDPAQGLLQQSASEAMDSLCGSRTMALYAMTRAYAGIRHRDVLQSAGEQSTVYCGSMGELVRDLKSLSAQGDTVLLYAGAGAKRLCDLLTEEGVSAGYAESLTRDIVPGELFVLGTALPAGFAYPELKLTVLGSQELYGRENGGKTPSRRRNAPKMSELQPGDYVVHETHGIGRFLGVETVTVQDNTRDYLLLEYKNGDRLYIPTEQLDRLQKYIGGGEDSVPALSRLGGSEWQGRVNRAREAARKLAVDLAGLYAARLDGKGFAFSPDTSWQTRMEARFPYRETPDQLESIREIKADMEKPRPMDRLLCGDVGYGKTEVALRAAFKAVQDGKQVAFLVPTTLLAQQHFNTISARFADFPVNTACLSRFQSLKERKRIKEELTAGRIDIVVGTHALLAGDVKFKDLGLLIVDEEQRFGVNHKEQLKELKRDVDVLTLSATPIPRTLNMSMTGVRDISVIETPPESRFPVQTYVLEYTDALLTEAVTRELSRGGQVYVVYNQVQKLEHYAKKLEELLPEARVAVAHGQMPEGQLEKVMMGFLERESDVLLCSTIIESGLDIPNVNTLIVIDADRFGLAQLYQLRGRVGRSNRPAYAYFTVRKDVSVNEQARRRLTAIREFTQFGAGYRLAMRDLEIRGAGSLLGAEQHGHIADIGYEYYCKLMRNALREVKGEAQETVSEVSVEIPASTNIPREYIGGEVLRLAAYRRIADAPDAETLQEVREELEDRYGELPASVENLIRLAEVRRYAAGAGLSEVTVRGDVCTMKYREDARPDGARLIAAVSAAAGAQLKATNPPSVQIRMRGAEAGFWLKILPQFLHSLCACMLPEEDL